MNPTFYFRETAVHKVDRFNHEVLFMVHGKAPRPNTEAHEQLPASYFDIGSEVETDYQFSKYFCLGFFHLIFTVNVLSNDLKTHVP